MGAYLDLITGKWHLVSDAQERVEDRMTSHVKAQLGWCDYACRYDMQYGWVPEADCPIHDRD